MDSKQCLITVAKREMYALAGDGTLAVHPIAFLLLMQRKPFELFNGRNH
jgi:hypothetical protein